MALTFRAATAADIPAIIALLHDDGLGKSREVPGDPPHPAYLDAFRAMQAQPGNEVILAVAEDGGIVGCIQYTRIHGLSRRGMARAQIEGVRVAAGRRGQKIGEALIGHAIERARAEGCGLVQLTSDKRRADAIRFYERLGFTASHEGLKLALD
ncbi:MAG: GNAT family N-acetyltransferase [Thalassobaculales bacterium]